MGKMNCTDLRRNELPFLIIFEIGEEGTGHVHISLVKVEFWARSIALENAKICSHFAHISHAKMQCTVRQQ